MVKTGEAVASRVKRFGPRRFASGLWHVPASFVYLLRHPSLWPLSLLPVLAIVVLVGAGLIAGYWLGPPVAARLVEGEGTFDILWRFGVRVAVLLAGMVTGLGLALLFTAPIQELLSKRVERQLCGSVTDASRGFSWEVAQAFRGAAYFLVRAPFMLLLGLIPVLGPGLAILWAAHSLAFQQTDSTLARHGLDFASRRRWHRRYRLESLGFGLGSMAALLVPVANLLIVPILVIGATRLALARLEP